MPAENSRLMWFHRNSRSIYALTLENQGLVVFIGKYPPPLIHRTFGGVIPGEHLTTEDDSTLVTDSPQTALTAQVYILTEQTETAGEWTAQMNTLIDGDLLDIEAARQAHQVW